MKTKQLLALALLGGVFALLPVPVRSTPTEDDPAGELSAADRQKVQDVEDLATIGRLVQLGHDKENPSPESLVTAAFLLSRLSRARTEPITEKSVIEYEKGAPPADRPGDEVPPDYQAEIKALLDEARSLAAARGINLEALIKDVTSRKLDRLVIGGPRSVTRVIKPKEWQTYHIKVEAQQPFYFSFRATMPLQVTVVRSDNDNVFAADVLPFASTHFTPGKGKAGQVAITIRFKNIGQQQAQYQMALR